MITDEYPYVIELHTHTTPVSRCSVLSPEDSVRRHRERGIDALVLTNHFIVGYNANTAAETVAMHEEAYEQAKAAGERYGVKVYFGAELRFSDHPNDYLVFGADPAFLACSYPLLATDHHTALPQLRSPERLIVQAHPRRDGMTPVDPSLIDGVELFNMSSYDPHLPLLLPEVAAHPSWILTAGSDSHRPEAIGRGTIRVKSLPDDCYGLAALLRSRDYRLWLGGCVAALPG